jgi:hypothetical protein
VHVEFGNSFLLLVCKYIFSDFCSYLELLVQNSCLQFAVQAHVFLFPYLAIIDMVIWLAICFSMLWLYYRFVIIVMPSIIMYLEHTDVVLNGSSQDVLETLLFLFQFSLSVGLMRDYLLCGYVVLCFS